MKMPTNLISLYARGREIGFVILDKDGMIYRYGVKAIRGRKSNEEKSLVAGRPCPVLLGKVGKTILGILELVAEPGVIVIESVDAGGRGGVLAAAIPEAVARFTNDLFQVSAIGLGEAKVCLCGRRNATIKELMGAVTERYPVFYPLVHGRRSHQVRYWQKAILAMALAMVVWERLTRGESAGLDGAGR